MGSRPLDILLVDDNPDDIFLTEEAVAAAGSPSTLRAVTGGREALRYLKKQGEHAGATRPDMVWLDLNLPGMDGHSVLREIRKDPDLNKLPVMILSSSSRPEDVDRAYALHANCYSVKQVDFDEFSDAIGDIVTFWSRRVSLPSLS